MMVWLIVSVVVTCAIMAHLLSGMRTSRHRRRSTKLWGVALLGLLALLWARIAVSNVDLIPPWDALSAGFDRGVVTVKRQLGFAESTAVVTVRSMAPRGSVPQARPAAGYKGHGIDIVLPRPGSGEFTSDGAPGAFPASGAAARLGSGRSMAWFALSALAVLSFLYLGYIFVDSGTRGQFTWPLRIISVAAFFGICAALLALRGSL